MSKCEVEEEEVDRTPDRLVIVTEGGANSGLRNFSLGSSVVRPGLTMKGWIRDVVRTEGHGNKSFGRGSELTTGPKWRGPIPDRFKVRES